MKLKKVQERERKKVQQRETLTPEYMTLLLKLRTRSERTH